MRIVVSGSTGLLGSALVARLTGDGHDVVRLVRGPGGGQGTVAWDPTGGHLDAGALGSVDAAVHLAGEAIAAHRWSTAQKARILDSRVQGTGLVARCLAELPAPPRALLSASAIGFYGDRGDTTITEEDGPGTGFLAQVCQAWEAATGPAEQAGIRVVHLRTGIVLAAGGGALGKQLPLFRLGVGGRLGSGRQYTSWISLADWVEAVAFTLDGEGLRGPVNLTAPEPVTNAEFTRALGRALDRPAVLPVPRLALSAVLGRQMAAEMLLAGQRVVPARLLEAGYVFRNGTLAEALSAVLAG